MEIDHDEIECPIETQTYGSGTCSGVRRHNLRKHGPGDGTETDGESRDEGEDGDDREKGDVVVDPDGEEDSGYSHGTR